MWDKGGTAPFTLFAFALGVASGDNSSVVEGVEPSDLSVNFDCSSPVTAGRGLAGLEARNQENMAHDCGI
jgi:hypothetical protein